MIHVNCNLCGRDDWRVRFADTNGIHHDHYREMTPYRDWVIRSFNDNLAFNKFVVYQLAGDLYEQPTIDQQIASGFNRLHISNSAGSANRCRLALQQCLHTLGHNCLPADERRRQDRPLEAKSPFVEGRSMLGSTSVAYGSSVEKSGSWLGLVSS